ncbi:TolC family protein [Endozoicomonas sp. Mp262]|uniref:TolC family protein n=1 Tax=Endozoicomonas sp. Mp262 TaxID=2919499 RepID=UPI0021DB12FF
MRITAILATGLLVIATDNNALSLQDAVGKALDFNPNVKSLGAAVDTNDARFRQSMGAYQPVIKIKMDKGANRKTNGGNEPASAGDWYNKTKSTLTLSQILYDFGRISSQVRARSFSLQASQHQLDSGKEKLAQLTASAFLEILKLEQIIKHVEDNIEFYNQFLEILEKREQAGASAKSDVQRILSLVQNSELELIGYKTDLSFARQTFKVIVGEEPKDLEVPVLDALTMDMSIDQLLEFALEESHSILARKATADAALQNLEKSRSDLYPKIKLDLEVARERSKDTSETWQTTESGTVTFSYDIWDGSIARRKVDEKQAQLMRAQYQVDEARLAVEQQVREAYNAMEKLKDEKKVIDASLENNAQIVELYYKEFELGEKSLLDITTAQGAYHTSRIQSASFYYDYYKSMFDIYFFMNDVIATINRLDA